MSPWVIVAVNKIDLQWMEFLHALFPFYTTGKQRTSCKKCLTSKITKRNSSNNTNVRNQILPYPPISYRKNILNSILVFKTIHTR